MDINLHIVLQTPPAGIDFGLQKGSGNKFETIQIQRSVGADLHFDLAIAVKGDNQKDALPGFIGPFAQGANPDKFLYIDIGAFAGQHTHWSRRLKIPLSGITWDMISRAAGGSNTVLETFVPGTGKDGTPNCATVKPFAGWKVKSS